SLMPPLRPRVLDSYRELASMLGSYYEPTLLPQEAAKLSALVLSVMYGSDVKELRPEFGICFEEDREESS
nr:hypothetical protein [Tanacetum cinerariifolium]